MLSMLFTLLCGVAKRALRVARTALATVRRAAFPGLPFFLGLGLGNHDHNDTHTTPSAMSSNAAHITMTGASGDIATATTSANLADAQEAIPGLPDHLVVTHILRAEYFDDPADLARLPAVSRAMCGAVAATGLRFEELDEIRAVKLGPLRVVERLQRGGRLSRKELRCKAAARSGQLEELKALRSPWDEKTCSGAAEGGHLDMLQWARTNGAPWNASTCSGAARCGHLEVLQWARANGCPWDWQTCWCAACGGQLEVLQWARAKGCTWNASTC